MWLIYVDIPDVLSIYRGILLLDLLTTHQFIHQSNQQSKAENTFKRCFVISIWSSHTVHPEINLRRVVTSLTIKLECANILGWSSNPDVQRVMTPWIIAGWLVSSSLLWGRNGVWESREWVLRPLTEAIFWDDDFMTEVWRWQRQMDEIHPVNMFSHPPARA